ncbi:MAG: MFS transporter [Marinifilaceae bacterium]
MPRTGIQMPAQPHFGGGKAWFIWAIVVVFVLFLFNVQTMFSVVQGDIQKALHLSTQQLTIIAGVYTWAFAIFQFFGGAFLDAFGSRKVLIPAFILVTAGVFLYGLAQDYTLIILAQLIMALGACVGFVGAGYIGGAWFGMAAYGTMFGYVETSSCLSSAVQQPITNWVLANMTYEEMFVRIGYFGIFLIIMAIIFVKNPTKVVNKENPFKVVVKDLYQIIKLPQAWICAIWGGVAFGLQLALGVVWAPAMIQHAGFSAEAGNIGSALCWAGLGVGSLFLPRISQASGNRRIPSLIGMLIVLVALILVIYVKLPLWLALTLMFLIGLGATAEMISFMIGADVAGGPLTGTSAAFVNAFMFIIGGILMNLPSSLEAHGQYIMYLPFVIATAIAIVLILIQKETGKLAANATPEAKPSDTGTTPAK